MRVPYVEIENNKVKRMKTRLVILIVLNLSISGILPAQTWQELTTVEDICKAYPDKMKTMMGQFNLDHPGFEKTKKAYQNGHLIEACDYLLEYYKNGNTARHLRKEPPLKTELAVASSDSILKDVFVIQNIRGKVPYGADGHRDWYYKGPNNDREWAWLSNRHSQINTVLVSYYKTGNPKYADYIDLFLRDFIIKSMPYPAAKSNTSVWRGLEVAARAKVWSRIFYGLLNSDTMSPSTQLLMLSSLPDHAHYSRHFHGGNNWLTMEISALATIATNFPEYKKSEVWLEYAIGTMTESMKDQVYADGVQTELTSHYHNVAMSNFELFKNICDRANKPLPDLFNQTIENMYDYIARAMRPSGYRILNNDGDRGSDRKIVLRGAKKFNNREWEFIATNGEAGKRPLNGPSYFYAWAGQLISRSGYAADAHWSFFDMGPWGSGHQHNDKLHLSISAFGRDLLVDAGRFAYTGEVAKKFRGYAKGTQGHNLVLIDEKGQKPGITVAEEPLSDDHFKMTPHFDYAWNSFDRFYDIENVRHTRALLYVRNHFWVVVDEIQTKKPRRIEALWHWHPDCRVEVKENGVVATRNAKGNLKIVPIGKTDWKVSVIKGQEKPEIQGWYSPEYNQYKPNTATIHSSSIDGNETFVWLLIPSEKQAPLVKAKLLSEEYREIKLEVTDKDKGTWELIIPYSNSKNAGLKFTPKALRSVY